MLFALLSFVLGGCGSDPEEAPAAIPAPPPAPVAPPAPPPLYGEDGELLPSETAIGGLIMPRGLQPVEEDDPSVFLFYTSVPQDKLMRYFGPRLFTGNVTRIGDGAVFRSAVPTRPQGTAFRMDVQVLARDQSRSLVRVRTLGIPGVQPQQRVPTEAELRAFDRRQD